MPSSLVANLADVDKHARCVAANGREPVEEERRMEGLALTTRSRREKVRKFAADPDIVVVTMADELVVWCSYNGVRNWKVGPTRI